MGFPRGPPPFGGHGFPPHGHPPHGPPPGAAGQHFGPHHPRGPPPHVHFAHRFLHKLMLITLVIVSISICFKTVAFAVAVAFSPPVLAIALAAILAGYFLSEDSYRRGPPGGRPQCRQGRGPRFGRKGRGNRKMCSGPGWKKKLRCQIQRTLEANNLLAISTDEPDSEDEATPDADSDATMKTLKPVIHRNETPERMLLSIDLPGFNENDIDISLADGNELTVTGSRSNRIGDTFSFNEQVPLDSELFNIDSVAGFFSEGVLEITIEKSPQSQPRKIAISLKPAKVDFPSEEDD